MRFGESQQKFEIRLGSSNLKDDPNVEPEAEPNVEPKAKPEPKSELKGEPEGKFFFRFDFFTEKKLKLKKNRISIN